MSSPRSNYSAVENQRQNLTIEGLNSVRRKRISSESSSDRSLTAKKKLCSEEDLMMDGQKKLCNFSSLAPNGVNRNSVLSKKQGTEKKILSIKNFRGKIIPKLFIYLFQLFTNINLNNQQGRTLK